MSTLACVGEAPGGEYVRRAPTLYSGFQAPGMAGRGFHPLDFSVSAHGSRALSSASFGKCGTDVEGRRADTEDSAYEADEQEIPPFDLKYIHVPAALYDPEHVAIKKLNDAIIKVPRSRI